MTTKTSFDAQTPCRRVWEDLLDDGKLNSTTGKTFDLYCIQRSGIIGWLANQILQLAEMALFFVG